MIVWGQSVNLTGKLKVGLDDICNRFNCVILTDRISNLHHSNAIDNAFVVLRALSLEEQKKMFPDIVITIGGNIVFNDQIKGYLKTSHKDFESWQVGPENSVADPYRNLTEMFVMK